MNSAQVAAALRILANAFEAPEGDVNTPPADAAAPKGRGRGRPVKGEETPAPATTAAVPATSAQPTATPASAADPFDSKPEPTATLDQVRAALTALRAATTQETALAIMKKVGNADNITELAPGKFYAVVAAATAALPPIKTEPVQEPADPFEVTTASTPTVTLTIEDVKAAVVAAQKHTSQDTVQKVVMSFGGKAPLPNGGEGPSLKALPAEQFAATIAALKALPTTK